MTEVIVYVDSSAHLKLVLVESESDAYEAYVDKALASADRIVSSALLTTEFGRAARAAGVFVHDIDRALARVSLIAVSDERLREAAVLVPHTLRSLDAIHLASATHVAADAMVVYDERLSKAARSAGFEVVQPE